MQGVHYKAKTRKKRKSKPTKRVQREVDKREGRD